MLTKRLWAQYFQNISIPTYNRVHHSLTWILLIYIQNRYSSYVCCMMAHIYPFTIIRFLVLISIMSLQLNYYLSERATNMLFFFIVLLHYSKYDKCKFQNTATFGNKLKNSDKNNHITFLSSVNSRLLSF